MRSVKMATWTSGEPVSSLPRPCSLISAALRSVVIDIVHSNLRSKVEPADDADVACRNLDQSDRRFAGNRKVQARRCGGPGQKLSMTEQQSLVGVDGEGRDVVQPRAKRENRPIKGARLSGFGEKVQRNGPFQAERAGARPPQHNDMADGAGGAGDVAGQAADVGALGDGGGQRRFVRLGSEQAEFVDGDAARLHLDRLAGAGAGVSGLAADLERRDRKS